MSYSSKLRLARRLLRDGATGLVPGIVNILKTTPSGPIIPDAPETTPEGLIAATDSMADRMDSLVALEAIWHIGGKARPALPVVVRIVEGPRSITMRSAISALGSIGDVSATHTLAWCLRRSDLQSNDREAACRCLCRIGKLSPRARSELADAMQDADPEVRRHAALALGSAGVPDAAPALVDLLSGSTDSSVKSLVGMILARFPHLPEPVVARLRELQEAGIPGVSERARTVLSLRDPRSRRRPANQRVRPDEAKEPRR
ncbi:MAG: HEAT repeat domain-containing protein [Planctomycetota bacterium]|jgi:HEAT repeat protein